MELSHVRWALIPLLLAGCPTPDDEEAVPANMTAMEVDCESVEPDATVEISGFRYKPSDAFVPDGGVIEWINEGTVDHTVTSGNPFTESAGVLFDSGNLDVGERYCLQLEGEGVVEYYCVIHPVLMQGATITVTPADGMEPGEEPGEEPEDPAG
jgi:plastocyanin